METTDMDEILQSLADHTGISVETAKTALGAVVAFLKEHLPEGLGTRLAETLPQADELDAHFQQNRSPDAGGGILGTLLGLASKFLGEGAGEATKLFEMLRESGLNVTQIETFLPKVFEMIKQHLPPEVVEAILNKIPGLGGPTQI